MRKVLSVSLPQNCPQNSILFAKATGRSKSDIIKESISLYLWESRYRDIRKRLTIKAKRIGVVTDENVFKVVS